MKPLCREQEKQCHGFRKGVAKPFVLMHISCVRGSPLARTVLVLLALVASGVGFARLTIWGAKVPVAVENSEPHESEKSFVSARFLLTLSSPASSVSLRGKAIEPELSGGYSGSLDFEKKAPLIFLKVEWKEELGSRRFAKLVIEAPGEETFTHVFDAPGDIDDFVELPF